MSIHAAIAKHQAAERRAELSPVRTLEDSDTGRWDQFVLSHPGATFYHLSGWRHILENVLGHRAYYLYVERRGEIEGVLPLGHVRSLLFGNALISVPFLVYGGPAALTPEARDALVEAACALAERLGVDYLELRNLEPVGDWPTKTQYVTFKKPIDSDPDVNMKAIPRKQRAMIRKGIKAQLQAEIDADSSRLFETLSECKRNLGTPFFSQRYLDAIIETFPGQTEILTVTRQSQTVCSVMSFRFRNEILPYYGGGGDLAREFKGNDFMYWAVMERAGEAGVEIFDYGRSTEGTGPYRFKKHWGFEPQPLYYQYHLVRADSLPNLSPTNAKYQFFINAWQRLPLPVARAIGPWLARRLG